MAQNPGIKARTTARASRSGGIRVLRSIPAISHMRELFNRGATSNYVYRIKRR